ncbi:MAG: hypothetical protein HC836_35270 [Richelia sp. RM2_1_2]|nr:hypothetical protein [Richelia sp. RM2_1_2]
MKKIIITESQYDKLIEVKTVKTITEKIAHARKTINESTAVNEAISDTLKSYLRKGLLTTAVIGGLLSNNVSAQELAAAGVPPAQISQATEQIKGSGIDINKIDQALQNQLKKEAPGVLNKYMSLPQEQKIATLKAIQGKIKSIGDLKNFDYRFILGSQLTPDKANDNLSQIGQDIVKTVSVDTVFTTVSNPVGNFFKFNTATIENPDSLRQMLQPIFDSYTRVDKIVIISSSSTLRNTKESEGKTWLQLSTDRANAVENVLTGMKTSCGNCGQNVTTLGDQISINPNGTNGDGTSGPPSPFEANPKYVQRYQEMAATNPNYAPQFWKSKGQGEALPMDQLDQYKQYQYVNIEVTGTVIKDKVEEMPYFDYLAMTVKKSGGKIKEAKKGEKQNVGVCKNKVKNVKVQKNFGGA